MFTAERRLQEEKAEGEKRESTARQVKSKSDPDADRGENLTVLQTTIWPDARAARPSGVRPEEGGRELDREARQPEAGPQCRI